MTTKRLILLALSLLASVVMVISLNSPVMAAGESWYWNGSDSLQAKDGFFKDGVELATSNNNDSTKPEFAIPEDSTVGISYACIGSPNSTPSKDTESRTGKCKQPADADAVNRCQNQTDGDCANVFIVRCYVSKLEVQVDIASNTVSSKKLEINTEVVKNNVHNANKTSLNAPECNSVDFGQIKNQRGQSAIDTSLNEDLEKERQRLTQEYIKQQCGANPSPSCESQAKAAFDIVFEACLANADNIAVSDDDSASAKIDSISICIEQKTGLKMDTLELERGLLSVVNYQEEKPSCALEWIGWIVCPVSRFMGSLADTGFQALEKILVIQPLERGSKGGDSLFLAWSLMRNIANVLFVMAFMVIIYSQITGFGLDNYGIKKLLPRLVIAALLVNTSFYIAIIMVDLSNIFGSSLYNILRGYADSLQLSLSFNKEFGWQKIIESIIGVTAAGTAIAGAALFGSLSALVPLLTTVVLALLTAIMLLVGRYALIVVLIIVAPVAFVAYLLPNTQKWFNMWYKTFLNMLMLYPIMGLIYGASYLAGIIVMNSAGSSSSNGVQDDLLQLFGMSITAIPLLLTPMIMKFGGGVLNRWGSKIQNNGLFKKAGSRADQFSERRKNSRDLRGLQRFGDNKRASLAGLRDKAIQRRFKKEAIRGARGGQLSKATSTHISAYMAGEEGSGGDKASLLERAKGGVANLNGDQYQPKTKGEQYTAGLAKGGDENALNRAMSQAVNARLTVHNEEVATAKEMLTNNFQESDWMRIAQGLDSIHNSSAVRQAAIEKLAGLQDNSIDEVVKSVGSMDGQLRYALARSIQQNNSNVIYNNPSAIKTIIDGGVTVTNSSGQQVLEPLSDATFHQQIVAESVNQGHLSEQDLASAEHETIADIQTAVDNGYINEPAKLSAQAGRALDNRYASESATDNTRAGLERLSGRRP